MAKTSPLKILRRGLRWQSLKKHFRKYRRVLFHAIIFSGFFAGAAFFIKDKDWFFPVLAVVALVLGGLQIWVLYSDDYDWTSRYEGNGVKEALLTLVINLFGAMAVYYLFLQGEKAEFASIAAQTTLFFSLPFFLDRAFYAHLVIPKKVYEPLLLQTTEDIVGKVNIQPCGEGIFFHFGSPDKDADLPEVTKRMYMPQRKEELTLEIILKAFIHHYNVDINPTNPIRLGGRNEDKVTYFKWYLYHRPFSILNLRRIVNPHKTIKENGFRYRKWSDKDAQGMQINLRCIDIYIERTS